MAHITAEHTYAATPAQIWAKLDDFGGIANFHPLVESSDVPEGKPSCGLGAERTCKFYDGKNFVRERVIESVPEQRMVVSIYEGSMPVDKAVATFELEPAVRGGTHVTMSMSYTPKFGFMGRMMNALVMERKFTGMLELLLAALDEHLRTGRPVGPEFSLVRAA